MKRVAIRAAAAIVAAVCGTAGAASPPSPTLPPPIAPIQESFEDGLGEWVRDSSVVSTLPYDPDIRPTPALAHSGRQGAAFTTNGLNDNAALWLERKLTLEPGDYVVKLSFWVWSAADAGAWDVRGAISTKDPEMESDLTFLGNTGITAGWRQYAMSRSVHVAPGKPIWLAVGMEVIFDVNEIHVLDDVVADIERQACRADFDRSGRVEAKDIFAFLREWFAGSEAADYNGVDGVNTQDIFDFLGAWFAGC